MLWPSDSGLALSNRRYRQLQWQMGGGAVYPWSCMGWYRGMVRGCMVAAVVIVALLWILERLAGWALG